MKKIDLKKIIAEEVRSVINEAPGDGAPQVYQMRIGIYELAQDAMKELNSVRQYSQPSAQGGKHPKFDKTVRHDCMMAVKYVVTAMKDIIGKLDKIDRMNVGEAAEPAKTCRHCGSPEIYKNAPGSGDLCRDCYLDWKHQMR